MTDLERRLKEALLTAKTLIGPEALASIDAGALARLSRYFELLREANRELNLTARDSAEEMATLHLLDSLLLLPTLPEASTSSRYLDLGTGAGIPGLVLKILRPELETLLVDSLKKRLNFLDGVIRELGLEGVETCHGRFEDLAHEPAYRAQFDYVTARAVAPLPTLLEYAAAFVRPGGRFVAQKASQVDREIREAQHALRVLNLDFRDRQDYLLPPEGAERALLIFEAVGELSHKYPRRPQKIKDYPL